ncbi:hypothetical protein TrVGV298_009159 [Trichoderma virens]|nr:hypothetical protein TrVGV298_009159 [Trichoderma virens]
MAHRQYPPPRGAVELDTSGRSQLDGEIFEMPGESMVPRPEGQTRKPVQAQDGDAVQANPWPFYLDQDVRTESRVDGEEEKKPGKADAKSEEQQPLANPWPYFGPMSPGEEEDGPKASIAAATAAGPGAGGSGTKAEESRTAEAKIEDASAAPPPLHLGSNHNKPAGDGASPASPAPPGPLPPATSESSSPPAPFYIAPLKLSRKQVPAAAAAPTFKPYLPPGRERRTGCAA